MSLTTPETVVLEDPAALGTAAAAAAADAIRTAIAGAGRARVLFASAPSQEPMLERLRGHDLAWDRVEAFHIDEYVGLEVDDPRGFGSWLRERLFDAVQPGAVRYLHPSPPDVLAEADRYARLLGAAPLDLACIGIGVNGHIAFNEPYDWEIEGGPVVARVVLHEASRQQQVDDGCFAELSAVPREALTVTVPTILSAKRIIVTVPGAEKAAAVQAALEPGVVPQCPATALQAHSQVTLFVDRAAYALAAAESVAP